MDQMEQERSPEAKLVNEVEDHINMADILLLAVLDVAEVGRQKAEGDGMEAEGRFNVIIDLLEQYQKRNSKFIESLYSRFIRDQGKAA
jgi:hypothetical protein